MHIINKLTLKQLLANKKKNRCNHCRNHHISRNVYRSNYIRNLIYGNDAP